MENEARIEESVTIIKEWISKSPHLPPVDEAMIRTFLRGRKYNLQKTKKTLELYYTAHHVVPEYFTNMDPNSPTMKQFREDLYLFCLPRKAPEGFHIAVSRLTRPPVADLSPDAYVKQKLMLMRIMLKETNVTEVAIIYDFLNLTVADVFKYITIPRLKKYLFCVKDAVPYRVKQIHIINAPGYVNTVLTMVKPLLKEKVVQRICVHPDNESLQKYLPKNVLPAEYGGDLGGLDKMNAQWAKKFEEYRNEFLKEEEMLRELPLPHTAVLRNYELFGEEGSFRKLNLD